MFQENQLLLTINDYIRSRFPDGSIENNTVRYYSSSKNEFNSLKNGVGLRITFNQILIRLTGKDVLDFLHRVSTNDLKNLKNFEKRDTIFLNEKGRFIDRTTLINFDNDFLLIGSAGENNRLLSWINKFIISEDIQTKDVSGQYLILDFIGPQAESFLSLLVGSENNSADSSIVRRFDVDGFTFHFFISQETEKVKFYKVIIESEKCSGFVDYLYKIKSVFDFEPVGDDAYNAFRIENGIPAFPNEINTETNPHEVNLLKDVSFTKGCYIGQEVIARLDTYDKVQKKLCKVILSENTDLTDSSVILDLEKNEAGRITTISNRELFSSARGLALLRKNRSESESHFYVESGKKVIGLEIAELNHKK